MATENKDKIAKLRGEISKYQSWLSPDYTSSVHGKLSDEQKTKINTEIARLQKQLDALLAENPHDDGTGRKPISYRPMKKRVAQKTSVYKPKGTKVRVGD